VVQPIVVRPREDGYEIVAGERRWRAARLAGQETIPAVVREEVSDREMLELALVENVQREDLDPIEKARGYQSLVDELGLTQEQVADRVGMQRASVANHLRLLDLPEVVQDAVSQGRIAMGHARALLGLADDASMVRMMEKAARADLSVRAVEKLVNMARGKLPKEKPAPKTPSSPPWAQDIQRRIQETLGTRVRLTSDEDCRGQIVIDFYERKDLDRLIEVLAPTRQL
jgi:ParB family chromosome partitioning protein